MTTNPTFVVPDGVGVDETLTMLVVAICDPCLDGRGGHCWTPGCLFWNVSAPDVPIRERAVDCCNGMTVDPSTYVGPE